MRMKGSSFFEIRPGHARSTCCECFFEGSFLFFRQMRRTKMANKWTQTLSSWHELLAEQEIEWHFGKFGNFCFLICCTKFLITVTTLSHFHVAFSFLSGLLSFTLPPTLSLSSMESVGNGLPFNGCAWLTRQRQQKKNKKVVGQTFGWKTEKVESGQHENRKWLITTQIIFRCRWNVRKSFEWLFLPK